jgi:hypothetical protein
VYFAGHGAVFDGTHYMLPIDFSPPPCVKNAALLKEKTEKAEAGEAFGRLKNWSVSILILLFWLSFLLSCKVVDMCLCF